MTGHEYKPGDPIEVLAGEKWRHDGRTYVGEYDGFIAYGRPGFVPGVVSAQAVRPYTPTVEIPDGWALMRSDELEDVHEVFDPADPEYPWGPDDSITRGYNTMLVVARRRADR